MFRDLFHPPQDHTIRQTSLDAYRVIQSDSTAASQRMQILHFLRRYVDGLTRYDIAEMMDIPINAVCGRANELIKLRSIREEGKRLNEKTRKENYVLKANEIQIFEQ